MGIKIFSSGEWERLQEGCLYKTDFTGLDHTLDRLLIRYMAPRCHEPWMPLALRRFRDVLEEGGPGDDPSDEEYRAYYVLREQVMRENDREELKKAAFRNGRQDIGWFAFCRLTGYRLPSYEDDTDDYGLFDCGLKSDMLREDIDAFCREMIKEEGPFEPEARKWLEKLQEISDDTLDEWADRQTERSDYINLSDELHSLLRVKAGAETLAGEELAETVRAVFDAYVLMVYEEKNGRVSRKQKYTLLDSFTRKCFESLKKMRRSMITDETEAVKAILQTGRAMRHDITGIWIRKTAWDEPAGNPQHSFFLQMAHEIGRAHV